MFSCDRHDKMMIVYAELECPLCKYLRDTEEAREHASEALKCLETEDLAIELADVADKLVTSMEKLRK
jgi:phage FluMu protein Com